MNAHHEFGYPDPTYLDAIARTALAHQYLPPTNMNHDYTKVSLPVYSVHEENDHEEYTWTGELSDTIRKRYLDK